MGDGFALPQCQTMKLKFLLPLILITCLLAGLIPSQPASAASPVPVTIVKFTKAVERGGKAAVIIKTTPGATCFLAYRTPSGRLSTTRGLGKKIANRQGLCRWSWNIYRETHPGIGSVTITVNGVDKKYPITIK
jgi:hypothetical protein